MRGRGKALSVRSIVVLGALLCAAFLLPSSATAALSLEESFATGGEPSPIAVDDSNGDIYFGDLTTGNVFRLDSTGAAKNFTCGTCSGNTLGGGFTFPGAGGSQIAVDSNSGRIYVTNLLSIEIFDNTGEFLGTLNGDSTFNGEYAAACGVAVDQSSGDVYVGDIAERVWRYTPDGGTIEETDYSGGIVTPMPACNVAAAQGIVYAADSFNVGEVRAFDNADFALGEPPSPSSTPIDTATTAIYADSTTADLYADKGSVIDVSDSSGADLYSFGSGDFGSSSGVAVMPGASKAYVTDAAAGEIDTFGPPPPFVLEESFATGGEPSPIAVDDSNGDIYFGDLTTGNVFRLDSTGAAKNFTCGTCSGNTLGGGFTFPGAGGSQIAVDSNSGRIYVTNLLSIEIFDNTGEFLGTLNGDSTFNGEYAAACGVAVDQSSGDVYVGDIAERVWRYTPDGGTIEETDYSGGIVTPMPACNVAAAQGIVYAADSFNVGEVRAFDNADFALGEPPSPSSTPIDTATTAIYADSTTADLYADKGSVIDVSDSSGADLYSFGSGDFGSSSGVAVMPGASKAYVTDLAAGEIDVYSPPPPRVLETSFATGGEPSPIAVDDSNGDIYVGDLATGSVSRLDSTGAAKNFTCGTCSGNTLGGGFTFPGAGGAQIAVDSNSGRIYVTNLLSIEIFDNTGEFLGTLNGDSTFNGEYAAACGVAVDQSSGNVYVGDIAERVWRYTPDGGTIEEADYSGGIVTPMPACNVAAAQGIVYAADSFNVGEVRAFDNTDFALGEPPSPSSTPIDTATTAIYADSTTADLYADKGSVIDVSDSSGADLYSFGSGDFGSSSGVAVMPSPTGNAYVTDLAAGEIDVFGPPPPPKKPFFELSIQKGGNGTGTVTSSPIGITCGLVCSTKIEEGRVVGLKAAPDPDSEFAGWTSISGGPGTCVGTTSPCQITITEPVELKAEFVLRPPTVSGLDPTEGPIAGGNPVTIEGTDFATAEEVEFGPNGVACPSLDCTIDSNTQITVNAPAHAAGTVDVIVTNGGGPSANTPADNYTYVEVPTVTGLDPTQGPTTGGTTVTIEGTDLVNIEGIKFGNVPAELASLVEISSTEIEIEAPAHSAGAFAVVVTTAGGPSVDTPADDYTYVAPPAVTGLSPNKGPVAGGNEVEITGMRLAGATQVEFGTTVVDDEEFIENTDSTIVVNAPAHEVGKVNVKVTTIGGTSGNFPVDDYTFEGPAALSVSTAGTGSGSVTCDGGACASTYAFGTKVTLVAAPGAGSSFGGWSGGGCAGTGPCIVTMEANTGVTATFNLIPPPPPPPPPPNCVVPKVKGLSLGKAKSALTKANCKTGKVTKPKAKKGKKQGPLVVKSSNPGAGTTLPANTKVDLRLVHKPKK